MSGQRPLECPSSDPQPHPYSFAILETLVAVVVVVDVDVIVPDLRLILVGLCDYLPVLAGVWRWLFLLHFFLSLFFLLML